MWTCEVSHNVFIEDYAYDATKEENKYGNWSNYIGNIYRPDRGEIYTEDVIKNKFKGKVICGSLPEGATIDEKLLQQMYDTALIRTQNTQKGLHRKDEENEEVTKTDLNLFLSVRSLNIKENNSQIGNQSQGLLKHKYYLLSSTTRIQDCAVDNGISDKVICNPKALIAYLSEAGLMKKEEYGIINLFDNRFLMHISNEIKETISEFIKVGLNLKGQNLVCMRYSLEEDTHKLLTSPSPDDYKQYYENVIDKGYELAPYAQDILKENKEQKEENSLLKERIKQLEEEKKNLISQRGKDQYQKRVNKKRLSKKKRKL